MANKLFNAIRTWGPFDSNSSDSQYYVQLNETGFLSCQCRGWTIYKDRPRSCTHITDIVIPEMGYRVEGRGQYLFLHDAALAAAKMQYANPKAAVGTPQYKFAQFISEYEMAVDRMAALPPKDMYKVIPAVKEAKFKVETYLLLLQQNGIDGTAQYEAVQNKLHALTH
jgi:hypothetical protein